MKIVTIVGARPQLIKAAVFSDTLKNYREIKEVLVHTGQHYDSNMSDIFFQGLEIKEPDYNLGLGGLSHGQMTGRMIESIESILKKEAAEWVVVFGDTNSTLAGALAAVKIGVRIVHIEAGLRSWNREMPEEINRILTDEIANLNCCPSLVSYNYLSSLNKTNKYQKIINSGDIMFEGVLKYRPRAKKPRIPQEGFTFDENFALITLHRAELTNRPTDLQQVIVRLNELNESVNLVWPIHPRTRAILENNSLKFNGVLLDPVGYLEMLWLIHNSEFVITDSGGLQKEAYFMKKMCFTLRYETEWIELVDLGFNRLLGYDFNSAEILNNIQTINHGESIYGDGSTSTAIIEAMLKFT